MTKRNDDRICDKCGEVIPYYEYHADAVIEGRVFDYCYKCYQNVLVAMGVKEETNE